MKKVNKILIGVGIGVAAIGLTWITISLITRKPEDNYTGHIKAGNDALARKDYETAKKEFSLALVARPGDPTAQAALVAIANAIAASGGSTTAPGGTAGLPNNGVACGPIRDKYDGDYDYIKCGGIWYTRSKPNAITPGVAGSIPNWKSLQNNIAANMKLNLKYPNG